MPWRGWRTAGWAGRYAARSDPLRQVYNPTILPGQTWPDGSPGPEVAPFRWVSIHNRGGSDVAISLDGAPPNDPSRYWDFLAPGERMVRNVRQPDEPAQQEIHALNLGSAPVTLWIETDVLPIVNLRAIGGVVATGGGIPIVDTSVFFVETTAALGANATFLGAWHDCLNYNWAGIYAISDQAFTLALDEADAAVPNVINEVQSAASAVAPAINNPAGQRSRIVPTKTVLRWIRVRVVCGATIMTRLNVQSTLSPIN